MEMLIFVACAGCGIAIARPVIQLLKNLNIL